MQPLTPNGLIHAEDLYYMLGLRNDIKVLDATYALQRHDITPFQAFLTQRIEGAQFFDIDVVADQNAPLPHTVPSESYFAACASALGISNTDHVVIYDQSGMYMASSRAWWLFRLFGHEHVYVLEGGLGAWISRGFRVVQGDVEEPKPTRFDARLRPDLIVTRNDLMENLERPNMRVLDARPTARFDGTAPEPRPSMRAGHIPGSYNLPFPEILKPGSVHFKNDDELEEIFSGLNISQNEKLAVSCGSGVTACTVALALFKARGQSAAIYDGSWAEWGDERSGTPIEVSA